MREVKFRVWDSIGEKWVSGYDVYMTSDGSFFGGDILNPPCNQLSEKEVTFCTGLKDKNGKDVYEGDILDWEINSSRDLYLGSGEVKFVEGAFWSCGRYLSEMVRYHNAEIIGNIYEGVK